MAYYSMTLRYGTDDPQFTPPTGHTPTAETLEHWVVPEAIRNLFEEEDGSTKLDTMILTFVDGTQVLWGTKE